MADNVESVNPVFIAISEEQPDATPVCLSHLCAANSADISRPRNLKKNDALVGKKWSRVAGRSAHNPKSASPYQRVREFPDEHFSLMSLQLTP